MNTEDGDDGTHISWMIPIVGKNERLEVSFEIKGSGEVDAEALNRFHGVHFGDEVETEDVPSLDEEVKEETDESTDDAEEPEEESPKVTWREDVLLRVMEAHGIEDRDAFIAHAAKFDHDDNGYLKKAELEDAAKAWNEANAAEESSEESSENSEAEETSSEDSAEENSGNDSDEKECPICSVMCAKDAKTCTVCEFIFV